MIEQFPNLKELTINSENVTELPEGLVSNCSKLERISMNGIDTIGKNCFNGLSSLTNIQLGDVKNIKEDAFLGCASLKEIEFPASLTSLSNSIVSCPLESITFNSSTPPTSATFPRELYLSCTLNVPEEAKETYQNTSPWNNFWNVIGFASCQGISVEDTFLVNVDNGHILIAGKDESDIVQIFNLQGHLITSTTSNTININIKGVYIVKIGNYSKKIIL